MITVLLIRHADAEEAKGMPDALRPLTAQGRVKMQRVAAALAARIPDLAVIASSPLRRAMETADILAKAYGNLHVTPTQALEPGAQPKSIAGFIHDRHLQGPCALVGHEPDLGRWVGWALCGEAHSPLVFKKGAVALLTFPDLFAAGRGELVWFLPPALLQDLP